MHSFTETLLGKILDYTMIGEVSFTWITNGLCKAIEKYETPNFFFSSCAKLRSPVSQRINNSSSYSPVHASFWEQTTYIMEFSVQFLICQ